VLRVEEVRAPEAKQAAPTTNGEKQQARTDRYGDPLPPGAVARLGTTRLREGDCVCSLAFSPDGKRLASGSDQEGLIRIWDADTGKELSRLRADSTQVNYLAFSRDGRRLVSTEYRMKKGIAIRLWDAVAGNAIRQFGSPEKNGYRTALSPDGKRVANVGDGGIRIWDTDSGRQLHQFGDGP
jgi:WD40 repeat protein